MKTILAGAALLTAMGSAYAHEGEPLAHRSQFFINGGLTTTGLEITSSTGSRLEPERGAGLNLSFGIHTAAGLVARARFSGTHHEGLTSCTPVCVYGPTVESDTREARYALLYSPPSETSVAFELGGGYTKLRYEIPSLGYDTRSDGPVVEGALLFALNDAARIDVGAAALFLEDDTGQDVDGGEFHAGITIYTQPIELGAVIRGVHLESQNSGVTTETDIGEIRLTLGGRFDL